MMDNIKMDTTLDKNNNDSDVLFQKQLLLLKIEPRKARFLSCEEELEEEKDMYSLLGVDGYSDFDAIDNNEAFFMAGYLNA
jgi:hypothetical protein